MTDEKLSRCLGPFSATMIIVGNVIGTGIFVSTGLMAQHLPSTYWILATWTLGGILALLGALIYGELSSHMPKAGGDYTFLKEIYSPMMGFMVGLTNFLIIGPASIAVLSLASIKYLQHLCTFISFDQELFTFFPITVTYGKIAAISIIFILSFIHFIGIKFGSLIQNILTVIKISAILLIIIVGFFWGDGDWSNLSLPTGSEFSISSFGIAMVFVIFTYSGWFASIYVAEETKNPQKNIPLSLIVGIVSITLIYFLINLTFFYGLRPDQYVGNGTIAAIAFSSLLGNSSKIIISIIIVISVLGSLNALIMTTPRIYYSMACDQTFFSIFKKLHPNYNTPWVALGIQCLLGIIYILYGTLQEALFLTGLPMTIITIITAIGLIILRNRKKGLEINTNTYRLPLYPWPAIVFIVSYLAITVAIFLGDPLKSLYGIVIILIAIPIYYLFFNKEKI